MNEWHVVSFSGGKDSTAMLLRMLELGMRVDEIIFCDTGAEFPQMYEHVEKVEKYIGRKITRLKAEHDFEYMLLHYKPRRKKAEEGKIGLGFSGPTVRWCTSYLKKDVIKRHFKGRENVIQYVGIAADESKRAKAAEKRYPLIDWNWTEAAALQYCYDKGFDWGGYINCFRVFLVGVARLCVLTGAELSESTSPNYGRNFFHGNIKRGISLNLHGRLTH